MVAAPITACYSDPVTMPAGYRAGVAQQPYTKYESDNDEVKVEYKRVENAQRTFVFFSGYKGALLRILLFVVVFLLGLILGYVIRRSVKDLPASSRSEAGAACEYTSAGYEVSDGWLK